MSKTRLSSRLANKQKQEFAKQTVVLILLSIVIGVIFIVIVLPNGVRLFFEIFDKQTDISQSEMVPPQSPIVSSPPTYINQENLELTGYAEPNSKIEVQVNNQKQLITDVDDSGNFSLSAKLVEGDNIIKLYNIDSYGNESVPRELSVVFDQTQPEIIVNQPQDGAEFKLKEEEVIQIQGETEPRSKVFINDRLNYAGNDGKFSSRFKLSRGENVIKIRVVDLAGNDNEKEIKVKYLF